MSFVMLKERSVGKKGSNPTALEAREYYLSFGGEGLKENESDSQRHSLKRFLWVLDDVLNLGVENPNSKRRVRSPSFVPVGLSDDRAVLVHEDLERARNEIRTKSDRDFLPMERGELTLIVVAGVTQFRLGLLGGSQSLMAQLTEI